MSRAAARPPEIRRILCHASRSAGDDAAAALRGLRAHLEDRGFKVVEGPGSFQADSTDLLVILGGDGFLMETLRDLDYPSTPVFGINFGSVGFLMNRRDCMKDLGATIAGWKLVEEEHAVLDATVQLEDGSCRVLKAFNDVVVERLTRQSLRLEVSLDGMAFNRFAGDGFILSTTAGSTAYNLAAGGPVVHPAVGVVLLTPLYSHRASPFHSMQFPLIVPLGSVVRIVASDLPKRRMRVVADGEEAGGAHSVEVKDSGERVRLLRPLDHVFVKTLALKFIGE